MIRLVSPVENRIEIPLEVLEEKLIQLTDPNFTGNLEATLRVRQTAALEIDWEFTTEKHVTDPTVVTQKIERTSALVSNDRVASVQRWLNQIRGQLRLEMPNSKLKISFLRGELRTLKIIEVD